MKGGAWALLVLLLCVSEDDGARGENGSGGSVNDGESKFEPPEIWAELKFVRDMVHGLEDTVEAQRDRLGDMEARVAASEEEAQEQRNLVAELRAELTTTKHEMEEMAAKLSASEDQVEVLRTRLNVTDNNVEDLKEESEAHLAQLSTIETRLNASEDQVQELRNKPKVAFSAGLGRTVGPFSSTATVVYTSVHSNIGNAYSSSTGVFTAPVKGVYQFRFTASHLIGKKEVGISMYKNGQQLIFNTAYNERGFGEYIANGIVVELVARDRVYMGLRGGYVLNDYSGTNHNTFSGVLVYSNTATGTITL